MIYTGLCSIFGPQTKTPILIVILSARMCSRQTCAVAVPIFKIIVLGWAPETIYNLSFRYYILESFILPNNLDP